ncbi:hypothetical protein GW17_00046161 [Ensete ventricosum]|nr:hypothetical protein GW17_00046161 [Ensete ventricosum]
MAGIFEISRGKIIILPKYPRSFPSPLRAAAATFEVAAHVCGVASACAATLQVATAAWHLRVCNVSTGHWPHEGIGSHRLYEAVGYLVQPTHRDAAWRVRCCRMSHTRQWSREAATAVVSQWDGACGCAA